MTRHPINFHRLRADHFSNATSAIFCCALAASPFSYFPLVTSGSGSGLSSTPFIRTWYLCSASAGMEAR